MVLNDQGPEKKKRQGPTPKTPPGPGATGLLDQKAKNDDTFYLPPEAFKEPGLICGRAVSSSSCSP